MIHTSRNPGLFPPAYLAAIEPLRIDARPAAAGIAPGQHLSRAAGASLDFRDFRPYSPGDDLRRVDWNVYRRTGGHLFIRRFDQPTVTPTELLIDDSASMFVEQSPASFVPIARMAGAIAAAALRAGDPLRLSTFAGERFAGAAVTGRRRLPDVLAAIADVRVGKAISIREAVNRIVRREKSDGVLVILSDLFETAGVEALTAQLKRVRQRIAIIQVVRPSDVDPTGSLGDDLEFVDCETGGTAAITPSSSALAAYRAAYTAYQESVNAFTRRRGAVHIRVDATSDLRTQLAAVFPNGVLGISGGGS